MRRIKLNNLNDNNQYYLLESKILNENEIPEIVKPFLEKDEIVRIIDEYGVKGSANKFVVVKRDINNNYLGLLFFDDDSDFIFLE